MSHQEGLVEPQFLTVSVWPHSEEPPLNFTTVRLCLLASLSFSIYEAKDEILYMLILFPYATRSICSKLAGQA